MTKASRSRAYAPRLAPHSARGVAACSRPSNEAIAAIRDGRLVIVVDDEDRENEGDLTIAAEKITPDIINFMVTHGRGLVCLAMTPERLDALEIPLAVPVNSAVRETAMCVPVDARGKTSTGISAADRAATVLAAIDPATTPQDLLRPGHVSRSARGTAASSCAAATRKRPSIWRGWPGSRRPASSAKSWRAAAPWRACPI